MKTVAIEKFGADHWSTFAYVCACIVGQGGKIQPERMRSNPERHLHLSDPRLTNHCPPTRLADGGLIAGHDDWDCCDDLIAAGLLESLGTGLYPCYYLTKEGWCVLREIVEYRFGDAPGSFASFRPEMVASNA
jgi:hypothetical protein